MCTMYKVCYIVYVCICSNVGPMECMERCSNIIVPHLHAILHMHVSRTYIHMHY